MMLHKFSKLRSASEVLKLCIVFLNLRFSLASPVLQNFTATQHQALLPQSSHIPSHINLDQPHLKVINHTFSSEPQNAEKKLLTSSLNDPLTVKDCPEVSITSRISDISQSHRSLRRPAPTFKPSIPAIAEDRRGRFAESTSKRRKGADKLDFRGMFREEIDNYPEEEIKLALNQTSEEMRNLFNMINTQLDPNINLTERIAHHHGDNDYGVGSKEESICKSVNRNIYPREVNRYNSLVYVPNTQEFMQVIQAEICQYPDQECSYLQDNLPYGMVSSCIQKYSYKKLLYFDPLEKRMATDMFRFPSCCSCHIRSLTIDLRASSALNDSTLLKQSRPSNLNGTEDYLLNLDKHSIVEHVVDVDNGNPSINKKTNNSSPHNSSKTDILSSGQEEGNRLAKFLREFQASESSQIRRSNSEKRPTPNVPQAQRHDQNKTLNIVSTKTVTDDGHLNHTLVLQEDKVYNPTSES